jgi:hypothetical protein
MLNNLEGFSVINAKNEDRVEDGKKLEEEFRERDEILVKSMISTIPVIIEDGVIPRAIEAVEFNEIKIQENIENLSSEIPTSQYHHVVANLERIPSSQIERANNNEEEVEIIENVHANEEEVIKSLQVNEEVENNGKNEKFDIIANNQNNQDIKNNAVEYRENSLQQLEQGNFEPIILSKEDDNQH